MINTNHISLLLVRKISTTLVVEMINLSGTLNPGMPTMMRLKQTLCGYSSLGSYSKQHAALYTPIILQIRASVPAFIALGQRAVYYLK